MGELQHTLVCSLQMLSALTAILQPLNICLNILQDQVHIYNVNGAQ